MQTLAAALMRPLPSLKFERQRIETPDSDFLDLDWIQGSHSKVAVLCHGLEGSSKSSYIYTMAAALAPLGFDILAWNFRGCSGEPNRTLAWYHSGKSEDLSTVIQHCLSKKKYTTILPVGFSVGGNIVLKYLAEYASRLPCEVNSALTFSVPCDLEDSALIMARRQNVLYMHTFLSSLRQKIRAKMKLYPELLNDREFRKIKNFQQFDDRYTAPLNGYSSATEYWRKNSSRPLLSQISIPTLILNARNDPFLGPACYPYEEAKESKFLYLETPATGGHVGFIQSLFRFEGWLEGRSKKFVETVT